MFLGISGALMGQEVSGTVTDDSGPLPGVSVVVKGTTSGTTTDFDGNYLVSANNGDTLVFSYVGYDTQEVVVSGSQINVILKSGVALDEVVLIGSRNKNRTAIDTPVPVDVIDVTELTTTAPQVTVNQILNYAAPSFSSNSQTIADGTDHLDPAQLRGLGPDQVLVLVNGKRRHQSSLVNVNGSVGRGSVGTDLNAIPAAAIKRIEVLRDGAAAQYGSDAVAGVINIVLKDQTDGLEIGLSSGANFTEKANRQTGGTDGENFQLDTNYGLKIGDNGGFINFTGSFYSRNYASRSRAYTGTIYNVYNVGERQFGGFDGATDEINTNGLASYASSVLGSNGGIADIYNAALTDGETSTISDLITDFSLSAADAEAAVRLRRDVSDYEVGERGQDRLDFSMRVGQSRLRSGKFFANMSIPLDDNSTELYAAAGASFRAGLSTGFYRRPAQERAFTGLYPNGFLPQIHSNIVDKSVLTGIKGKLGDWDVDFSNSWGRNSFNFDIRNSANATLQGASDLSYEAGGFSFQQNTLNLDATRFFDDVLSGLNIAWGAEYRAENYMIEAGSEGSYGLYNDNGDLITDDSAPVGPADERVYDNLYRRRPAGVQVFPGYRPQNEVDKWRNSIAGYIDVEADFSENVLVSGAVRYENYSDFGGTLNGKLATRIKASENFNIRGAVSTGFRAPSLHQIYFNSVSTLFVGGEGFQVLTAKNDSKIARDIGISQLEEETSVSVSLGFTAKIPSLNLKLTVDGYITNVNDRITLTDQIRRTDFDGNPGIQDLFTQAEAERVQFFGNFVDTKTQGLDIVISHRANIGENMTLNNDFSATFSDNEVTDVHIPTDLQGEGVDTRIVSAGSRAFIENAFPRTKANLSHNLKCKNWNFFLRNALFGEVFDADTNQNYASKVITDLTIGYKFSDDLRLTLGANNLLDVYPDEVPAGSTGGDQFIYSRRVSQFGTTGRQLFARLNFEL
ncbi:TonB-dependent receptor [Flaviramulus aquimarinus]|uniref:TonB-dependent receptor n=2 Tax=Flaviramulus aquimarinus TaxID=1170456 RepID=A0ABP9F8N2_9FLAO